MVGMKPFLDSRESQTFCKSVIDPSHYMWFNTTGKVKGKVVVYTSQAVGVYDSWNAVSKTRANGPLHRERFIERF